ncbi:MAG: threonine synthase [Eubacteriales bacterium]|nr:threonine synthase [Eubacteriales bacterium]
MQYISTRGLCEPVHSAEAIRTGLAPDGGLYVPDQIPQVSLDDIVAMSQKTYAERALSILSLYLTDYDVQELSEAIDTIYGDHEEESRFQPEPAPLVQLNQYNEQEYILELWHGPSAAFKDLALQLLPYLMTTANNKSDHTRRPCVLTATSGDTGKATLEGFRDIPGTQAIVFYPNDGISDMQKLQMITQEGDNCHVVAIEGTFDDAQRAVKQLFMDEELSEQLKKENFYLTSANSINWGRLVPQIVYYFSAYADLLRLNRIEPGENINFVVPTGNFGNILAGWYAFRMGLPINKLICASNRNNILSDFIRNGHYDKRRPFYKTNAPSMDILISSNLERLLFELTDRSGEIVREHMRDLAEQGHYQIDAPMLKRLQSLFVGGFADDKGTLRMIREVYDRCDHVIDTHTAVGFNVYGRYRLRSNDEAKTVFVSTASPFKFPEAVSDALFGKGYANGRSLDTLLDELAAESGLTLPVSLQQLSSKQVNHHLIIPIEQIRETVRNILINE